MVLHTHQQAQLKLDVRLWKYQNFPTEYYECAPPPLGLCLLAILVKEGVAYIQLEKDTIIKEH